MLDAGHQRANFAIVATGPNAASPHHDPTERVIASGDVVLCDFGGTMHGYCRHHADVRRGEPTGEAATRRGTVEPRNKAYEPPPSALRVKRTTPPPAG